MGQAVPVGITAVIVILEDGRVVNHLLSYSGGISITTADERVVSSAGHLLLSLNVLGMKWPCWSCDLGTEMMLEAPTSNPVHERKVERRTGLVTRRLSTLSRPMRA